MKNVITMIIIGVLVLPLGVLAQDHSHHNMKHDEKSMESKDKQVKQFDVSTDFQKQLNAVYQASLKLNAAFVASDAEAVKSKAASMSKAMEKVKNELLEMEANTAWVAFMKPVIDEGLVAINASDDIAEQRKLYAYVADALYTSVKSFGVGKTVYYQYCPMVKASWLNDSKDIKNPYYGSMMLTCGSTKEVLN